MNGCKIFGALILIILFFVPLGHARGKFLVSADFSLGFPLGIFNENIDRLGMGGSGYFAYKLKNSPFSAGLSISVLVLGSQTRVELFASNIPEVEVDVTTRNYVLLSHLVLRIQPPDGDLRPYVEGLLGFNYLWTQTGVYDRGWGIGEIASSVNQSDFAWSAGAGGGLLVRIYEREKSGEKGGLAMYMDFGARYLFGGKAEYMSEGGIILDNGHPVYNVLFSRTDLISTRIGIIFVF